MSIIDFKNQIAEINNELYDILSKSQNEIQQFTNQINTKLVEQYNEQINILKNLENNVFDNENNANLVLDEIKAIINNLHDELKAEVTKYQNEHVLDDAKTNLFNAREENLQDFINAKKKKTAEINQKIKFLDNQCLLNLKTKNQEIVDAEKKHKARIQELDRKTKFETEKIEAEILTPGPSLKTNADDIEKLSKEEVVKIRVKGINEIKNTKVKYASIKKFESIKHLEFVINTKKDSEILREEYNQQIAKLQYLRNKEQRELEKGLDNYNFSVYHRLNELEKTYLLEENKIIDKYYQQISNYSQQMYIKMKNKQKQKKDDISLFHLKIKQLDQQNIANYLASLKRNLDFCKQNFHSHYQFFIKMISLFQENIFGLITNLYEQINNLENYNYFISAANKQTFGFNYQKYQSNIKKINDKFYNIQKQTEDEFLKILENNLAIIVQGVENLSDSFQTFLKQQNDNLDKYFKDFDNLIDNIYQDSTKLKEEKYALDTNANAENVKKMKSEMNTLINDLDNKNTIIFAKYQQKSELLKQKIKEYNNRLKKEQKKDLSQYNNTIKNIKNNIAKIKRKYRKSKQEAKKEINQKFNIEIKEFEAEKKTKLKIGQI